MAKPRAKSKLKIPPDDASEEALTEARNQIEAMTGDWDKPVRFRLIDQRHDVPKKERRGAVQLCGSLDNKEFYSKLWKLNCNGYDVYVIAQEVDSSLPEDAAVHARDVKHGRVIVADFDDIAFSDEDWYWHIRPTCFLRRENSEKYFWAIWRIDEVGYTPSHIPGIHKQVIQRYGSDPSVCDRARIIRLAGFDSHKREKKTRYVVQEGSGEAKTLDDHKALLPEFKRKPVSQGDENSDDYVSEKRLRFLLKNIDPEPRDEWIVILGAIKDAQIGRDDSTYMEPSDKNNLADQWSGGKLGKFNPTNYQGEEDVINTMESLSRGEGEDRATIGSLVHMANEAGMDELEHRRLQKAEIFTHPDRAPKTKQDNEADSEDHNTRYSDRVRYFEGVLTASGGRERLAKRLSDIPPLEELTGANWAIDKWLLRNATNALFGESETFKTYVTINMLLCVATGTPWGAYEGFEGYAVDGPRDVILFAGEGYDDLLYRIHAAIRGEGFDRKLAEKHLIIVADVYSLNEANGLAGMADEIEELDSRPALIAVDTYNLALDGNEDSSDEAKRALRGLRALANLYDAAGLVLHHPGWGDTKRPRGSSAFRANMDVMIFCERSSGRTKIASLTQYKNRSADKEKYCAAFFGKSVDLGVDPATGKPISNLSFSPITPSAVPKANNDDEMTKIRKICLYAEALEHVLLVSEKEKMGPEDATRAIRQWLTLEEQKVPSRETIRQFLYKVRDAITGNPKKGIKGDPEYIAAYLIHNRKPLEFSHPEQITGIKRAPRMSANRLFQERKEDDL